MIALFLRYNPDGSLTNLGFTTTSVIREIKCKCVQVQTWKISILFCSNFLDDPLEWCCIYSNMCHVNLVCINTEKDSLWEFYHIYPDINNVNLVCIIKMTQYKNYIISMFEHEKKSISIPQTFMMTPLKLHQIHLNE